MRNHFHLLTMLFIVLLCHSTILKAQERVVEVTAVRNNDNSVDFFYKKTKPGSYTVKLEFENLKNTFASDYYEQVINENSGRLTTLRPTNKDSGIGYGYKTSYVFGNARPKVDSLFQYILPFKLGKKSAIYESWNISEKYLGAQKVESWKSYSIKSKTSDSIFAMRKGIVVDIKNDFQNDTLTKMIYTSKTNNIVIEHEDGTYATYKGFKKDSFKVKLGDTVYPNTMLGTLNKFNNENYILHFTIYYIDNSLLFKKSTLKTPYIYLTPYFYTKEGVIKVVSKSSYTADCTDTILTKEMTKKEIKQRLKSK